MNTIFGPARCQRLTNAVNLITFSKEEAEAHSLRLDASDPRYQHIVGVLGSQCGDSLRVGQLNGNMGRAEITTLDSRAINLQLDLNQAPPAKLPLTVLLALPRPKMLRRILRSLSELGVAEIILINSAKVEKSFWSSPVLEAAALEQYLIEGLQQSRDTVIPKISLQRLFKPFVEDQLPSLLSDRQGLVAHPGLGQACSATQQDSILAIGPEGGFTSYEVEKLLATGFTGIHLGERILRVETAVVSLTAQLFPTSA